MINNINFKLKQKAQAFLNENTKEILFNEILKKLKIKQATLTEKAKETLFKTIVKTLDINFYIINRDGIVIDANDGMMKVLGIENKYLKKFEFQHENQAIGQHVLTMELYLQHPVLDKHLCKISTEQAWLNSQKVMETGQTMTFEEIQITTEHKEIYYHSIKTPIFDDDNNEVIGLVGISIDITERKNFEIATQQGYLGRNSRV